MKTQVSADQCNVELLQILDNSLSIATSLEDLLHDERSALESQNSSELMGIITNKEQYVRGLATLESERQALCKTCGFESNASGMQDVLNWCDGSSVVTPVWNSLLQTAKQCEALNNCNGAIGRIRYEHVMSALAVLNGSSSNPAIYGPKGKESARFEQRALAHV